MRKASKKDTVLFIMNAQLKRDGHAMLRKELKKVVKGGGVH